MDGDYLSSLPMESAMKLLLIEIESGFFVKSYGPSGYAFVRNPEQASRFTEEAAKGFSHDNLSGFEPKLVDAGEIPTKNMLT